MMDQMQFFPNPQINNNFFAPPVNTFGNNFWMIGYNVDNNINNNNNIFPNNQTSMYGNKLNILFKTSHGKRFIILFDLGRTVEDLILTFFKRINQEYLFHQGGVFFIYNTKHIDYHLQTRIEQFFKFNTNPIIMVLDINNLIGASYY